MERIPEKIDSRFRFVLLAAERAEQIMRGARPKLESAESKYSRVAMEEVTQDLLTWEYGPAPEEVEEIAAELAEGDEAAATDESE